MNIESEKARLLALAERMADSYLSAYAALDVRQTLRDLVALVRAMDEEITQLSKPVIVRMPWDTKLPILHLSPGDSLDMNLPQDQRIVTLEFLQRMTIACAVAGSQKAIDEIHAIIGEKK